MTFKKSKWLNHKTDSYLEVQSPFYSNIQWPMHFDSIPIFHREHYVKFSTKTALVS